MTDPATLPASVLRALASIAEQRERGTSPWRLLDDQALEEATAMLAAGTRPGFGWWRTHLRRTCVQDWPTPIPDSRRGQWQAWELVAAAVDMGDTEVVYETALDVLAQLAADHGLDAVSLRDAYIAITP